MLIFGSCSCVSAQTKQEEYQFYMPGQESGICLKNTYTPVEDTSIKGVSGVMTASLSLSGTNLSTGLNTPKGRTNIPGTKQWILYWGDGSFTYKGGGSLTDEEQALPILQVSCQEDDAAAEGIPDFTVRPNPCLAGSSITFEFKREAFQSLAIFDLQGREVARMNPSGSSQAADVRLSAAGTYIARYTSKDGVTTVKKIVIE